MNRAKRFFSVLFAAAVFLCALPPSVFAEEEAAEEKPAATVTICGAEVPADTKVLKVCGRTFRAENNEYTGLEDDELIKLSADELPLDIKEVYKKLPELRRLTAAELPIKNPEYLSKFKNLSTLELYECTGFDDASFLADCKGVTVLRISVDTENGLYDLSEIGKMTQLKKLSLLYFTYSNIDTAAARKLCGGDISFLKNLTGLKELKLYAEHAADLSALSSLKRLTALDLDVDARADIKVLSKLSNLTELTYSPCYNYEYYDDDDYEKCDEPVDLSPLKKLKRLKKLSLDGFEVYDEEFSGFKNLKELSLYYVNVRNRRRKIDFTLPKLDKLYLKESYISAEMLAKLRTLKELTMEDCGNTVYYAAKNYDEYGYRSEGMCEDISYVKNMKNLKKLTVTDYGLENTDIEVLSGLTKLEYLDISHNEWLDDISPLKDLKNLKYLDLEATNYKGSHKNYLEPLKELKNLEYLNIYDVYFSGYYDKEWYEERERWFEVIKGMKNLKKLIASGEYASDPRDINEKADEKTIKKLKKSLPDCEIELCHPVICVD